MRVVEHFADILEDDSIQLVASAAIPNQRAEIGVQVLEAERITSRTSRRSRRWSS